MNGIGKAQTTGRLAGLAYLGIILFSIAGYATLTRLLEGDPQAVLERLAAHPATFTLAIVSSAIGFVVWLAVGFLLYALMGFAWRLCGRLMLVFMVAGTAMSLFALLQLLPLVGAAGSGMDAGTLAPHVQRYNHLLLLSQIFSGLWLFPLGGLILRSQAVPRVLGLCLAIGGVGYVLVFATAFAPSLSENSAYQIVSGALGIVVLIGEFGTCLWLLGKGAREPQDGARRPQTA